MEITSSIKRAPEYMLHRDAGATDGASAITTKAWGVNTSGYESAHVQVVPAAGVNPGVAVQWWCANAGVAGEFIGENSALAKTGLGNGIAYEFTVPCKGRVMFIKVDAATKVYVSGFGKRHPE